jgi:hypothetical protein
MRKSRPRKLPRDGDTCSTLELSHWGTVFGPSGPVEALEADKCR